MLFWWFGLKLYFGDKRIPDELHMEHETKEKPAMSPRIKSSKSFFCLLFFLCAIFLIYLKLPLEVKRKECSERREDHGVRRDNGGRNRERHPSGGGPAGSPSERASWGTFPTGNRRRWNPALWAVFHSMRQAPEVSLGRYGCLYILSLEKKRLGRMKMNSSVEISLEKKKKTQGAFYFCSSFLNLCFILLSSFSLRG